MFDFSMLQQLFGGGRGQGLLGQQPYGGQQQPQMGQQQPAMPGYGPNVGNPYAMGIPTQPQATAPYQQYSPYTQGGSPYTQTGWTPSFQDYFSPFQDLRQEWQDQNALDYTAAQQPQTPPNGGQHYTSVPYSGIGAGMMSAITGEPATQRIYDAGYSPPVFSGGGGGIGIFGGDDGVFD